MSLMKAEMRAIPSIFWAIVPGFNVYAATRKSDFETTADSTGTWKVMRHVTSGPYVLNWISWANQQTTYPYSGVSIRVTADGNVFNFQFQEVEDENVLPFPIIAKEELKIEMKKRGTVQVNAARAYARWDRLVTQ